MIWAPVWAGWQRSLPPWMPDHFPRVGRVTDEWIAIVKRLCQGGEVTFQGEHYQLGAVVSNPGSVQRPHLPILIGGTSQAALRRAATGGGWVAVDGAWPGALACAITHASPAVRGARATRGRSQPEP